MINKTIEHVSEDAVNVTLYDFYCDCCKSYIGSSQQYDSYNCIHLGEYDFDIKISSPTNYTAYKRKKILCKSCYKKFKTFIDDFLDEEGSND